MSRVIIALLLLNNSFLSSQIFSDTLYTNLMVGQVEMGKIVGDAQWGPLIDKEPFNVKTSSRTIKIYTELDSSIFEGIKFDTIFIAVIILQIDTINVRFIFTEPYINVLRKGNVFNDIVFPYIPTLTYQDSSSNELRKIREKYNLDSIAGYANESSRIINLMEWVHNNLAHDGSVLNPSIKNSNSLIERYNEKNEGLTCRGLAIVLNEFYLALGIPSRFVTCMPKDSIFDECHVINSVYSKDLGKWLWIDPTHEAYVMDENGNLQSILEVREKLISGEKLILNPSANWNNKESTVQEYYLDQYMAKNLYRLQIPIDSKYDLETYVKNKEIRYLELLPIDGYNQDPKIKEEISYKTGAKVVHYKTNNLMYFINAPVSNLKDR